MLTFQRFERLIVAAARKKMRQLRIDRLRQRFCQGRDLLRDRLQAIEMLVRIAPADFIGDNRKSFPEGRGKLDFE